MQLNDSETLIKILDCSFSTPQRPNVNENSINLIRSLLRKDPKSRLTIKQILEHAWLKHNDDEQQQQSPKNEILIDQSITTATTTRNQSTVNQQQQQQQNDDNKENQLEEKEVAIIINKQQSTTILDDEMIELRKKLSSVESYDKSKNFDGQLHDNVIDQMINRGMCNSKEQVENAIKESSRKIANASKSEIVKKIIPNKDELADETNSQLAAEEDKNSRDCYNTDNKLINQHLEENSSLLAKEDTEKAYLTATYNLMKDKISREQQGINLTNQVQRSTTMHHKKVLPTRPRKSIIKQPQFGLSSSASSARSDSSGSCELNENQIAEEENQKLNSDLVAELPVYEEDANGLFMLPLARKCSIVSEEGSCVGNSDYSGNECSSDINSGQNSISNYNSLNDYNSLNAELNKVRSHSYLSSNQSNNSSKRNSRENLKIQSMPIVNIVITDFSNTIEEDERLEVDELNNCTIIRNDEEFTSYQSTDNQKENRNRSTNNSMSNYFCPMPSALHQASSSPDLGREEKLNDQSNDHVISKEDEDKNENAFDEHVMNQLNQSTSSKISSLHTSMRVIMQSKSCNNILCSGLSNKEEHCSDCEIGKELLAFEQQQQSEQLDNNLTPKDQLSNKSSNLSIFSRLIGKKFSKTQKESTKKRLSLENLEPEEALATKEKLNNNTGFAFRKCKTDKINCCAMS